MLLQVDLKLKVCRGTSIKKILVREAKSYSAAKLIVGTARNHHKIRSSTTVAKYCAKKLSKECGILAVNNGKIVFKRDGPSATSNDPQGLNFSFFFSCLCFSSGYGGILSPIFLCAGAEDHRWNGLLGAFHLSQSVHSEERNDGNGNVSFKEKSSNGNHQTLEECLAKAARDNKESVAKENCSICAPASSLPDKSCNQSAEEEPSPSGEGGEEDKSLALVPVERAEDAAPSSISVLIREIPEVRPGWPLLRRAVPTDRQGSERSLTRKIPVVQWAMQLPSRYPSPAVDIGQRQITCDPGGEEDMLDSESGAIVPVGTETMNSAPSSPGKKSKNLPQELEGFHDKYSSTCRLFKYQELLSATSNFLAGLF